MLDLSKNITEALWLYGCWNWNYKTSKKLKKHSAVPPLIYCMELSEWLCCFFAIVMIILHSVLQDLLSIIPSFCNDYMQPTVLVAGLLIMLQWKFFLLSARGNSHENYVLADQSIHIRINHVTDVIISMQCLMVGIGASKKLL